MNAKFLFLVSILLINASLAESCQLSGSCGADVDSVLDSAMLQVSMFAAGWLMFYSVTHRWVVVQSQLPHSKKLLSGADEAEAAPAALCPKELDEAVTDDQAPQQEHSKREEGGVSDHGRQALDGDDACKGQSPSRSATGLGSRVAESISRVRCALEAELEEADVGFPPDSRLSSPSAHSESTLMSGVGCTSQSSCSSVDVAVVAGVAKALQARLASNGATTGEKLPPWRRTCFHDRPGSNSCSEQKEKTKIALEDFLERLHWYFECSGNAFVIALAYIDRLLRQHPDLPFSEQTSHRLFLASLVVALKYHDDEYPYKNSWYAEIGNIPVQVLNEMEAQLCKLLEWKLFVGEAEYERCYELITYA